MEYNRNNKVKIQNLIINNLDNISNEAFKIFISILNDKNLEENKKYTVEEIITLASITKEIFYNNIKYLTIKGILVKDTKSKESYVYYINPFLSEYGGFILLERATIKIMLLKLNATEIKLYTLMYSMLYEEEYVFVNQNYLAERLGENRDTIYEIIKSLEGKKFITIAIDSGRDGITYHLNY